MANLVTSFMLWLCLISYAYITIHAAPVWPRGRSTRFYDFKVSPLLYPCIHTCMTIPHFLLRYVSIYSHIMPHSFSPVLLVMINRFKRWQSTNCATLSKSWRSTICFPDQLFMPNKAIDWSSKLLTSHLTTPLSTGNIYAYSIMHVIIDLINYTGQTLLITSHCLIVL